MPTEQAPPKPYTYCFTHMKVDCPLCATAKPNPDLNEVVSPRPAPEVVPTPPVPPPPLSDPKAQAIVEAARKYANSVEAYAIISDQVKQAKEVLAALEKKLEETKKDVEEAMKGTRAL